MTLTEKFLWGCESFSDKTAVSDERGSFTYGMLLAASHGMAGLFKTFGPGNNVGICMPSSKECVASYFALLLNRQIPVFINPLLSPQQVGYIVKDASLDTVVTVSHFKQLLEPMVKNCIYLDQMQSAAAKPSAPVSFQTGDPEDTAAIFYTSGTSANPKGVVLSHRNIISNLEGCVKPFGFSEKDVFMGTLPLFHAFAFTVTMALPVMFGAQVIYVARFSGPKVLKNIENHRVTVLMAVASMYRALLRSAQTSSHDTSSLRLAVTGGEPVPMDIINSFESTFKLPLIEGYGLTECSPMVSVNSPEEHKYGTAGKPLPNLEVKIVDDSGSSLPTNQDGEIWVKGPNIMKGYLNQPELTGETITPDGWFKTGDYGRFDEDGFLKITGRKKELIIISGENISPVEIEDVLSHHPKVFEVAVVGVPDKMRGEVPRAFIVLHDGQQVTEDELKQFCHDKLQHYKIPKYFEFHKELPHGPTGKILKRALPTS
ncbi:MAG: AMP-binding protein [Candidatus Brocadiales bacterium]|nr:AMP-binding protein [Candidatus Bathyanammoxibius amoris]